MAGTLERFTESAGVLTYVGTDPITPRILGSAQLLLEPGIETDQIEIAIFVNGSEVTSTRVQHTLTDVFQTPTSPYFNCSDNISLVENDTIDIRMRNVSNATDVTATDAKILIEGK